MDKNCVRRTGMVTLVVSALAILFFSILISYQVLVLAWIFLPLFGLLVGGLLLAYSRHPSKVPSRNERKLMSFVFLGLGVISIVSGGYHFRSEGVFYIGLIFIFIGIIYFPNKEK